MTFRLGLKNPTACFKYINKEMFNVKGKINISCNTNNHKNNYINRPVSGNMNFKARNIIRDKERSVQWKILQS